MVQKQMLPPDPGSKTMNLVEEITIDQTEIAVTPVEYLLPAPNRLTIVYAGEVETLSYTGIDLETGTITGVIRGEGGTTAKTWPAGARISRLFTAADYSTITENIDDHEVRVAGLESNVAVINQHDHDTQYVQIAPYESDIAETRSDIDSCEGRLDSLEADVAVLNVHDHDDQYVAIAEYTSKINEVNDEIAGHTARIDTLETEMPTKADIGHDHDDRYMGIAHTSDYENPHRVTSAQVGNGIPQWNANKIHGRTVSNTGVADKRVLMYDVLTDSIVWSDGQDFRRNDIWERSGQLLVGTGPGTATLLAPGANGQILLASDLYPEGVKWETLTNIMGVGNDLIWDVKGDIAVGIGINKSVRVPVGTEGQILRVDPETLSGVRWTNETTVKTDPIWNEAGTGSLIAKHWHQPEQGEGRAYIAPIPIGTTGDVLTVDQTSEGKMSWKPLTDIHTVANDRLWGATKGQIVIGVGARTAIAITPTGNNLVLVSDNGTATGYRWEPLQNVNGIAADEIWQAKNDLIIGTGNSIGRAKRLPIGSHNQIIRYIPTYDQEGNLVSEDIKWSNETTITTDPMWKGCNEGDLAIGMRNYPQEGSPSYWGARLPVGQNGQVLAVDTSAVGKLVWKFLDEIFNVANDQVWEVKGDLVVGAGQNQGVRLPRGVVGQVLTSLEGDIAWATPKDVKDADTVLESKVWTAKNAGSLLVAKGDNTGTVLQRASTNGLVLTTNDAAPNGLSWSLPQPGVGIRSDIAWTMKGDLVAGTGTETAETLHPGAMGQALVIDPTTETGLAWKTIDIPTDPIWQGCNYGDLVFGAKNFPTGDNPVPQQYWGARLGVGNTNQVLVVKQTYNQYAPNHKYLAWENANGEHLWSGCNYGDILVGARNFPSEGTPSYWGTRLAVGSPGMSLAVKRTSFTNQTNYSYLAWEYLLGAKGELLVGTGSAPVKLPVGSNGSVLTADQTAPAGLVWRRVNEVSGIEYDPIWEEKGDIAVGIYDNKSALLKKGNQGQALVVDNATITGYNWRTLTTIVDDPIWFAKGDLLVGLGTGQATRMPRPGELYGQVIISDPTSATGLTWTDPRHIVDVRNDNTWDQPGDLLVGLDIDSGDRLAAGLPGQVLMVDETSPCMLAWKDISAAVHSHETSEINGLEDAVNEYIDGRRGAINGVASLDITGKIPSTQIPALAITEVKVVATEAEQLALTVQEGDVCVRTDLGKTFIAVNENNLTLADWQEILTPVDGVVTVNGQTGVVSLGPADVGAAPTIHNHDESYAPAAHVTDATNPHNVTASQVLPAGGTDGQFIVVDSTNPDGYRWVEPNSWAQDLFLSGAGCISSMTGGCIESTTKEFGANKINVLVPEFNEVAVDPSGEWDITLPDTWIGKNLTFKVVWFCENAQANNVEWELQGRRYDEMDGLDQALTTIGTVTDANNGANIVNESEWSVAGMIGGTGTGNHVHFKIIRKTSGENDTLAYPAFLLGVLVETTDPDLPF